MTAIAAADRPTGSVGVVGVAGITGVTSPGRPTQTVATRAVEPATERPTVSLAARAELLAAQRWPALPSSKRLTFGQRITDELAEFGNQLGYHLGQLSNEMLALSFDGRQRRARVMLGADDGGYLVFKLRSDVHFTHGVARINAKLDLGIGGHVVRLDIPEFEMAPTSYRGERGVEVRLPLIKHEF
jgi:hypothetical protein